MALCTQCREQADDVTRAVVGDTTIARLCDPCEDEIFGDKSARKLQIEG